MGDDDYEPERPIKKSILIKRGYTNIHSNEETEKMSGYYNHDLLRLVSPGWVRFRFAARFPFAAARPLATTGDSALRVRGSCV